ncbi:hypothetical protein [Hyunsoonleella pacifica]
MYLKENEQIVNYHQIVNIKNFQVYKGSMFWNY